MRGALAFLAVLVLAAPAEAAKTVDVPAAFRTVLPKVRARTQVPILLPSTMKLDFRREAPILRPSRMSLSSRRDQPLYPGGAARRSGYALALSATRRCGGGACF